MIWMRRTFLALFMAFMATTAAFADEQQAEHEITVVSNGWHTAIVARREALAETGLIPELADFPAATFIEFGWGDRTYYPSEEKSVGLAIGAAIGGSPAVMHLNGLSAPADKVYPKAVTVALTISRSQMTSLASAIDSYFQRNDPVRWINPVV